MRTALATVARRAGDTGDQQGGDLGVRRTLTSLPKAQIEPKRALLHSKLLVH